MNVADRLTLDTPLVHLAATEGKARQLAAGAAAFFDRHGVASTTVVESFTHTGQRGAVLTSYRATTSPAGAA